MYARKRVNGKMRDGRAFVKFRAKADQNLGRISACKENLPGCSCCYFSDNYIVLLPGEIEASKQNKDHIIIIDENYFGGKRAVCTGPGTCTDNDFKPLDCKLYPYFPSINGEGEIEILKGSKCPLTNEDLADHRKLFFEICCELIKDARILEWLKRVQLIGYQIVQKVQSQQNQQ